MSKRKSDIFCADEGGPRTSKQKCKPVTMIFKWVQGFCIYVAVLSRSQPERVLDLMSYQALIIQTHLEFQDGGWLCYDRTFRLRAASQENHTVEPTLWSLAFSRTNRCRPVSLINVM